MTNKTHVFKDDSAEEINRERLLHLASLNLDLKNKTVLEVGSGIGKLTHFFERLGCDVLSTEVREENIAENRLLHPERKIEFGDLSIPGSHEVYGKFDIVFCYGTLYHLKDPSLAIKEMSNACNELLLLSTCVSPTDNGAINNVDEPQTTFNQSFEGVGCRPGRDWVISELKKFFPYVYMTKTQPNHLDFPLEWPVEKDIAVNKRAVFVASRVPLENELLSCELLSEQYIEKSVIEATSVEGVLFDGYKVKVDLKSMEIGGSWSGEVRDNHPTAWDSDVIKYFYDKSKAYNNPVIFDIGASTGSFSLLQSICPELCVYAFEPNPLVYRILNNNINVNGLNIKTENTALSDYIGKAVLKVPISGKDSGLGCIGTPKRFEEFVDIEVPTETLDAYIERNNIQKLDMIKIDTEGCELFVLKGAEQSIRKFSPVILLECNEDNTEQFGYKTKELKDLLFSWGYRFRKVGIEDLFCFKK